MERRELLHWLVATGGLTAINRLSADDLLTIGQDVHRAAASPPDVLDRQRSPGALDASALSTVTVAAERIFPGGNTPGASDADVSTFIDRMLADWYSPADRARFLAGLTELDARSIVRAGRRFVECTPADQVALLEALDAEVSILRQANAAAANEHWFAMLKYLTVWGYCTSMVGMRDTLHSWPMPMRYDGNALVTG